MLCSVSLQLDLKPNFQFNHWCWMSANVKIKVTSRPQNKRGWEEVKLVHSLFILYFLKFFFLSLFVQSRLSHCAKTFLMTAVHSNLCASSSQSALVVLDFQRRPRVCDHIHLCQREHRLDTWLRPNTAAAPWSDADRCVEEPNSIVADRWREGRQNERNGWNAKNISPISCLLPPYFLFSKRPACEFHCRRHAQPPPLCGRRSPTTHLLDLNLRGHSPPTQFYPSCSIPHRERPLSSVKEVDKFDLLPEESSPLWWWLIVPGVAHCPFGIHHCRLSGDERTFFFEVFGMSVPRVTTTHAPLLVPFIHHCIEACMETEVVFCQSPLIYL